MATPLDSKILAAAPDQGKYSYPLPASGFLLPMDLGKASWWTFCPTIARI